MEESKSDAVAVVDRKPKQLAKTGPADNSPAALIRLALEQGHAPEALGKLLDVQERLRAIQALAEYTAAMNAFKSDAPAVIGKNADGQHGNKYATLDTEMLALRDHLVRHGLNVSWKTKRLENGNVWVSCRCTHVGGHFEESELDERPDTGPGRNAVQAMCSTVSYLKRYTFESVIGIVTANQDDDGNMGRQRDDPDPRPPDQRKPAPKPQRSNPHRTDSSTHTNKGSPIDQRPTDAALDRLRDLVKIAHSYAAGPDPKIAKVAAAIEADVMGAGQRYAAGKITKKGAGAAIGAAKKKLESIGWTEPQEWIDARKKREAAKRAEKKAVKKAASEPDPQQIADAKADRADLVENSELWAKAAHMQTKLADAGVACDALSDLWRGRNPDEQVPAQEILAAISAGQAAFDQAEADNDPGEPPTQDDLARVVDELNQLAGSHNADAEVRKAVQQYLDLHHTGDLALEDAEQLRDQIQEFYLSKQCDEGATKKGRLF